MIASFRTLRTSSGEISGSGFAIAKIIGFGAIDFTISFVTLSFTDKPTNTSAPTSASANVRAFVLF